MQQVFSPKQVARAIGASESSVKRWCDRGILKSVKTGGGHRRVPLSGLLEFIRAENRVLVSPVDVGLPTELAAPQVAVKSIDEEFKSALAQGNYPTCRRVLFGLYLAKHSIAKICDDVLAPAMNALGEGWCNGSIDVFEERRACELTIRLIYELRSMLPSSPPNAPTAMGGSIEDDPYSLPTRMVELVLLESGWNAVSLGCGVPLSSLKQAIQENHPRLFWLSISTLKNREGFVARYSDLFSACNNVAVVLGGRGLDEELRARIQYSAFCDNLQRLETFAHAVQPRELKS